ncbi:hypothetical protein CC86DRAFT_53358 [Ophiobolus disseminans]|uniref:MOSC domain-containing protein n=1 Tax=Ophiobolus disseminans TaxID=1469910 RepID=A0A6A6ZTW9_9PLEO|nr:hypothetical protein CC86DRAFT_53358 [Ophiobolus disseminans]
MSNALDSILDTVQFALSSVGINISPVIFLVSIIVGISPAVFVLVFALLQRDAPLPPPAGCRKLGLQGPSNLEDQYSKKYALGGTRTPSNPWTIKALFIYPLKSAAPVEIGKGEVIRTGFKYDRQFSLGQLVSSLPSLEGKITSEWQFLTQRKFPRLAKVEAEIWVPDPLAPGYTEDGEWVKSEGCIVVRFPFSPDSDFSLDGLKNYGKILAAKMAGRSEPTLEFKVPFNSSKERQKSKGYTSQKLQIWNDKPEALDVSSEVDPEILAKLKYTLGTSNPVALFRIDPEKYREVKKNAPKKEDVGFQTIIGMQDSYPIHMLNLASIHDVASKLPRKPIPYHHQTPLLNALRFRANIYITGPPAFHEDTWTRASITPSPKSPSKLTSNLHVSCRTTRCKLPNVDPETGVADRNEPGTTLRSYRVIDEGSNSACLGMMITPLGEGEVSVGDYVEVTESGEHHFLKE